VLHVLAAASYDVAKLRALLTEQISSVDAQ
jgi:hypothetical protein